MASITVQPELLLERMLTLEIVRVTERAAVSAARLRGRGKEKAADQAAVDAMRRELNKLPIDGTVVIGEGELDEAPMLFIGEKVGNKNGPKVDIAVDPLEGTTLCAKNMPGAIATHRHGRQRHAAACAGLSTWTRSPSGPAIRRAPVDLDAPAEENIVRLAKAKGVKPADITAILLDRPRHADMIAAIRKTRRRGQPDQRRRRRRRHPLRRAEDRHRHLSRHRRRAGRRAGGGGAALHRRSDADPAGASTPRSCASAR